MYYLMCVCVCVWVGGCARSGGARNFGEGGQGKILVD